MKEAKPMKKEDVYQKVLDIAKMVAKAKEGTLFIIARKQQFKGMYKLLYPQIMTKIFLNQKGIESVLVKLAELDGAILISEDGEIIAHGAMIKKTIPMPGFGTKHSAAKGFTAHVKKSIAVLVSEKMDWIKIFKEGRIVLEMDSRERPASVKSKVVAFLNDGDTALFTAAGISAAILGFAPILVLSGTYLVARTAGGIIRKNIEKINER